MSSDEAMKAARMIDWRIGHPIITLSIENIAEIIDDAKPQWTRVEDGLPEEGGTYWVTSEGILFDTANFNVVLKHFRWTDIQVSHWMPIIKTLPPPPKEV